MVKKKGWKQSKTVNNSFFKNQYGQKLSIVKNKKKGQKEYKKK